MHKERKLFYFWLRRSLTRVIFEVGFHQHWTQNSCWASHLVESFELVLDTYDELCGKMPKATIPAQLSLPHVPTAVRSLLISIHYSVCFRSVHYCWSKPVSFSGTPRCLQPWPSCRCCCPSLTSAHNLKEEHKHMNHFDNHLLTVLLWTGNLDSPCLLLGSLSLSQPLEVSSSNIFLVTLSKASVVHRWNLFPLYLNSDRVPPGCLFSQDTEWYSFPLKCLTYLILLVSYVNGNWQALPVRVRQGRNLKLVQAENEICLRGSPGSYQYTHTGYWSCTCQDLQET